MKKNFAIMFLLLCVFVVVSCTDNQMAKKYGGKQTITLDAGQRVVNVTWKEQSLWILTKIDSTKPTVYSFKEKSSLGFIEGEVVIVEK